MDSTADVKMKNFGEKKETRVAKGRGTALEAEGRERRKANQLPLVASLPALPNFLWNFSVNVLIV